MPSVRIVPASERKFARIALDQIRVVNSRNREQRQFEENVRSIGTVGQLKPIVVNGRHHGERGVYDLVCGEGRYLAHQKLGRPDIAAEIIDCDDQTALLLGMVENIARVPPDTMWFAGELKRLRDAGFTYQKIGEIVGKNPSWVSDFILLVEQGEERLIKGLEQGLFSMAFARTVARAADADVQHVLMDAFDSGLINSANAARVREIIEFRVNRVRPRDKRGQPHHPGKERQYTLATLRHDLARLIRDKEDFVRQATTRERRLLLLVSGMKACWQDAEFVKLMSQHGITSQPELSGNYE